MLTSVNRPPENAKFVLDNNQGWVALIDKMGEEIKAVNSARVSFGKFKTEFDEKDATLLNFLIDEKHFAPLEHITMTFLVHCPLYVRGQWHRHRCLSGDTEVWFTQPNGRNSKMTLSELYRKWTKVTSCKRKDRQKNSTYSKDLISKMAIKFFNEQTEQFETSNIVDVMNNGVADTFKLTLSNGFNITGTADHKVLTKNGWKEIKDLTSDDSVAVLWQGAPDKKDKKPWFFDYKEEIEGEIWKRYRDKYLISSYGRVKTTVNTKNVPLKEFKFKKKTINNAGYPCVSISDNGKQEVVLIHKMMAEAFGIEGNVIRHLDDNKLNCFLDNLKGGTDKENRMDAKINDRITRKKVNYFKVVDVVSVGQKEVFDLTINHSSHNYIANGIVVHNCASYNEISRRYTEMDMELYTPVNYRIQSENNKQASIDNNHLENSDDIAKAMKEYNDYTVKFYEELLEMGVCREQARGVLPQNMMTTFYCTMNMRNCLHFLSLRMENHAQWEIRVYANAMHDILKEYYPNIIKAFDEGRIK